jgi:hypothetical protein
MYLENTAVAKQTKKTEKQTDTAKNLDESQDDLRGIWWRMPPFTTGLQHLTPFSLQTTTTVSCPTKAIVPNVLVPLNLK